MKTWNQYKRDLNEAINLSDWVLKSNKVTRAWKDGDMRDAVAKYVNKKTKQSMYFVFRTWQQNTGWRTVLRNASGKNYFGGLASSTSKPENLKLNLEDVVRDMNQDSGVVPETDIKILKRFFKDYVSDDGGVTKELEKIHKKD